MPSFSADYYHSSSSSPKLRRSGTVIQIGADVKSQIMPAQKISKRYESSSSTSRWSEDGPAAPTSSYSRPQSRSDSAASNVSLKDRIDVFVEDKFLKSYDIKYEPVRIRIGDDEPGDSYQSRVVPTTTYGNGGSSSALREYNNGYSNGTPGVSRMRSSYHENTKTTTTSGGDYSPYSRGDNSASVISIGSPDSGLNSCSHNYNNNNNGYSSSFNNTPVYSPINREYNVPIGKENDGYSRNNGGTTTIPISRENDRPHYNGRQSTFSPDSGRDSVELPVSRMYDPTPVPSTPFGRNSVNITSNYNNDSSYNHQPADVKPWSERARTPDNRFSGLSENNQTSGRQKSVDFSKSKSPTPEPTVRPSVHFNDDNTNSFRSAKIHEPLTTNFTIPEHSSSTNRQSRSQNPSTNHRQNSTSRRSPDFHQRSTPLNSTQEFNINPHDLYHRGGPTPPPLPVSLFQKPQVDPSLVNKPSLTYAAESPEPGHRDRSSSRNRNNTGNLARNDSQQRPSSRAGLPSYERDYVDRDDDYDSDLDDLADAERNERLRQKQQMFPFNRNAALIAELKETTGNISATRRSRKEEEFLGRLEKKDHSGILDRFTAEQFIPVVPYYDEQGFPIAEYKRAFLAKQAANQARRDFQMRINAGEKIEDIIQSPELKKIFIDQAKEEYDGAPFKSQDYEKAPLKLGAKESLQINLNKGYSPNQPFQMELVRN